MKKNVLVLGNCAGLFHWSNSNYYYGTKEHNDLHRALYNALRELHGGNEGINAKRDFPYTLNENGKPIISYKGYEIVCNDRMIESIEGEYKNSEIINNRYFADFKEFDSNHFRKSIYRDNDVTLYSNKFNSLSFHSFQSGLLYYRLSFKNSNYEFIVSGGKFYEVRGEYKEVSISYIFDRLEIISEKARKECKEIFDFIIK